MGSFTWTQYSFNAPGEPLTREAWLALRSTSPSDHNKIIEETKAERWSDFWHDTTFFKWSLGIFIVGLICFNFADEKSGLKGFGALAVFFTFVACISLLMSASSHATALLKQCRYLRQEFAKAAAADTYEIYLQRHMAQRY